MTYSWQAAGTVEALHGLIHSVEYRRKYAFWRVVSLIQAFLLQEDLCKHSPNLVPMVFSLSNTLLH